MADKYLYLNSGRITEREIKTASAGAGDAGKAVGLDGAGRIDNTMMPVGIGADTALTQASENLAAGDLVNVWNSSGARARKADATTAGKEAVGFVLSAVTSGQNATVYFEGTVTGLTGLTIGARYYVSAAAAGQVTDTPPSAAGNVVQYVGTAITATSLSFEPDDGIVLA